MMPTPVRCRAAPSRRPGLRFRTRVFGYIAILSLATSMASAGVYYWRQLGFIEHDRARHARTLLGSLATEAELGAYASDASLCELAARRTFSDEEVVLTAIYDRHGRQLLNFASPQLELPPPDAQLMKRLLSSPDAAFGKAAREDFDDLYAPIVTVSRDATQAMFDGHGPFKHEVVGVARVGLSRVLAHEQLAEVLRWGAFLAIGLLAIGLAAAWLISRWVAKPVAALTLGAERLGAGHFGTRVDIRAHDELGQLGETFNRMAERLNEAIEALAALNRNLESEVARRTHDLEVRNTALGEQRDRLQEMNRLKSEFLANTSHELRTPLNVILGYLELLREGIYGLPTEEQKGALQGVDEAARNLLVLINQILDLAKVEAGKMAIDLEEVDMGALAEKVIEETAALARDRPYPLMLTLTARPKLRTDGAKVKQILMNLLSNAIKFTADGEVELRVGVSPSGGCTMAVRDTGIGIRSEDVKHIFEEFRQVDGSSTRSYGGSGLGLAIARRYSELLGGEIRVQSEVGAGSTFTLELPAEPPEPGVPRRAPLPPLPSTAAAPRE